MDAAQIIRVSDLEFEFLWGTRLQAAVIGAAFAVYIDVDSPGGEIAGRPGLMRALVRRGRARRYSRSPAWRQRARRA